MKIAILVPSRERLNLQLTLISSIITTVDDINNVVLYFGIDEDDPTRATTQKIADAIDFVEVVPIKNGGKFIGINKIWNILAEHAMNQEEWHDIVFGYIGDDMVFRTNGWDTKILNEFEASNCPSDFIKLVHCDDGYHKENLCVNAFIHETYFHVVGYLCREEFLINWSDRWLYQSFKAFDRITYMPDIFIEHNHWVFGRRAKDKTGERMGNADQGGVSDKLWITLAPERVKDVVKIGDYLGLAPNWSVVER
jgi:hypothetical protein